jgi:hypothetical protein
MYSKSKYPVLLFSFAVTLFIFSGCQQEKEEIAPLPADKVILPNSALANLIQRIAFKDGSSDNILDKSSCASLVLPVTVLVNGQEIKVSSKDDFKLVERILDEVKNDKDTLAILFPVTVILADYTSLVIHNEKELKDIRKQCKEGGMDDDIECVDFQYPLTFSVYDSNNQLSNTKTINSDNEIYEFFHNLKKGDLISFKFPFKVVLYNGEEITISDNNQLEDAIENAIGDCDEDDDNDYNDDDVDVSGLIAVLTDGQWEISSYFDKQDETAAFANFVFTFLQGDTALATNGVSSVNGKWKSYGDMGVIELDLDFGREKPLDELKEDWEPVEFSNSIIKLKNVSGGDGAIRTLAFRKK